MTRSHLHTAGSVKCITQHDTFHTASPLVYWFLEQKFISSYYVLSSDLGAMRAGQTSSCCLWSFCSGGEGMGGADQQKTTEELIQTVVRTVRWTGSRDRWQSESVRHSVMPDCLQPHRPWPTRFLCPQNSPGKKTRVGSHSLLQGILLTQGSNLGLPHCRQVLHHLSQQARDSKERLFFELTFRVKSTWGAWFRTIL